MGNKIPFIVKAIITPERGNGKRLEVQRSRERIAYLINNDLVNNFGGNIASPGGSGESGLAVSAASLSDDISIVAVKPQMGESPDMVTIAGFYNPTDGNVSTPPYPTINLIHAGTTVNGPLTGNTGWNTNYNPSTESNTHAKDLKSKIQTAITSVEIEIVVIEINGIRYGWDGFHFPR